MKMIFIIIFLLIFFVSGCGDKFSRVDTIRGYTKVTITNPTHLNGIETVPNYGNLISVVNSSTGNQIKSYFLASSVTQATFSIPNGTYHFFAIGYNSPFSSGAPLCSAQRSVILDGNQQNIVLTMSTGTSCNSDVAFNTNTTAITDHPAMTSLVQLSVGMCTESVSSFTNSNTECGTKSASAGSMKIGYLDENVSTFDTPAGLLSPCSGFSTTSGTIGLTTNNLAIFATGKFKMVIYLYSDGSCATKTDMITLPQGIGAVSGTANSNTLVSVTSNGITDISDQGKYTNTSGVVRLFIQK